MDIATLPAIGWTLQRCPECRYEAVGQSRKAVLEALIDHQFWHMRDEMLKDVFGDALVELKKASA